MGMAKEHEAADDREEGQGHGPSRIGKPTRASEKFNPSHPEGKDPIGLVLQDLRVMAGKRLCKSQRPNRPRFVIAPN